MTSLASCAPLGLGDLVKSLGGWPNLMQGLGSNLVAGFLAGLVAWIILRRTRRNESRLADELDARAAARELMAALSTTSVEMSKIQETDKDLIGHLAIRLVGQIQAHEAAIELVDSKFVEKRLHPLLLAISNAARTLAKASDPFTPAMDEVARAYAVNLNSTNKALAAWLSTRSKSSRTRWKRIGSGSPEVAHEVPPESLEQPSKTPGQ